MRSMIFTTREFLLQRSKRRNGMLTIFAQGLPVSVSPFGEQLAQARYLLENCIKMPIVIRRCCLSRRKPLPQGATQGT